MEVMLSAALGLLKMLLPAGYAGYAGYAGGRPHFAATQKMFSVRDKATDFPWMESELASRVPPPMPQAFNVGIDKDDRVNKQVLRQL